MTGRRPDWSPHEDVDEGWIDDESWTDPGPWSVQAPIDPARPIRLGALVTILAIAGLVVVTSVAIRPGHGTDAGEHPPPQLDAAAETAPLGTGRNATARTEVEPPPLASKPSMSSWAAGPTGEPTGAVTLGELLRVLSVTDGDTVRVLVAGVDEPVRIIGLDSPESRRPGTPVECMAHEATQAAKDLLEPTWLVSLEDDPTQDGHDRYGRRLAHVFLSDGRLFSEEMIRRGYAVHYVYGGERSIYAERLAAAETAARREGLGLWDASTCGELPHAPAEP